MSKSPKSPSTQSQSAGPRTVLAAKRVDIALVSFNDERGEQHTTLAVVGDKNVHLLNGRDLGFSRNPSPQGPATDWMRDGIFKLLGKE